MKIEQIYTDCLSEASYYIESEGESLIIDLMKVIVFPLYNLTLQ